MTIQEAKNPQEWDSFLAKQTFRPFLQSWTMGEVYRDTKQEPIRLEVRDEGQIVAVCQAILVPARRGRHLMIPYGPVLSDQLSATSYQLVLDSLIQELTKVARAHHCAFIRMSPFWPLHTAYCILHTAIASPLHLLAEYLWYLPLVEPDPWKGPISQTSIPPDPLPPEEEEGEPLELSNNYKTQTFLSSLGGGVRGGGCLSKEGAGVRGARRTEEQLLMSMRKTTRNLIRRAEKDGVTIEASPDPNRDIEHFLTLHEETRRRHGFTPYTNTFFRSQVRRFSERSECTLYLARFQGEVAAASIHMHMAGETSYHHGASTHRLSKVPASYLLQWTAIRDALKRSDRVYNFWGIAPIQQESSEGAGLAGPAPGGHHTGKGWSVEGKPLGLPSTNRHPFAGVTLFKTGFGGSLLPLTHCMDFPISPRYHLTRAFELLRKWRRGF